MLAGILIDESGLALRHFVEGREIDRARIDHRPFDQPALRKLGEMRVALPRIRQFAGKARTRDRDGRIDDGVAARADAFDDARIDLPVVLLPAGRLVIGMQMDDGGAGLRAGDAVGDDLLDGDRNARLPRPRPRPVQRRFEPDRHLEQPLQDATRQATSSSSSSSSIRRSMTPRPPDQKFGSRASRPNGFSNSE